MVVWNTEEPTTDRNSEPPALRESESTASAAPQKVAPKERRRINILKRIILKPDKA